MKTVDRFKLKRALARIAQFYSDSTIFCIKPDCLQLLPIPREFLGYIDWAIEEGDFKDLFADDKEMASELHAVCRANGSAKGAFAYQGRSVNEAIFTLFNVGPYVVGIVIESRIAVQEFWLEVDHEGSDSRDAPVSEREESAFSESTDSKTEENLSTDETGCDSEPSVVSVDETVAASESSSKDDYETMILDFAQANPNSSVFCLNASGTKFVAPPAQIEQHFKWTIGSECLADLFVDDAEELSEQLLQTCLKDGAAQVDARLAGNGDTVSTFYLFNQGLRIVGVVADHAATDQDENDVAESSDNDAQNESVDNEIPVDIDQESVDDLQTLVEPDLKTTFVELAQQYPESSVFALDHGGKAFTEVPPDLEQLFKWSVSGERLSDFFEGEYDQESSQELVEACLEHGFAQVETKYTGSDCDESTFMLFRTKQCIVGVVFDDAKVTGDATDCDEVDEEVACASLEKVLLEEQPSSRCSPAVEVVKAPISETDEPAITEKPATKPPSIQVEILKVVLGSAAGILIAYSILYYGFDMDPFGSKPNANVGPVARELPAEGNGRNSANHDPVMGTLSPRRTNSRSKLLPNVGTKSQADSTDSVTPNRQAGDIHDMGASVLADQSGSRQPVDSNEVDVRHLVPASQAQQTIERRLLRLLDKEFFSARDDESRTLLTRYLLKQAEDLQEVDGDEYTVERFVVLRLAFEQAVECQDANLAKEVIREIGKSYRVDQQRAEEYLVSLMPSQSFFAGMGSTGSVDAGSSPTKNSQSQQVGPILFDLGAVQKAIPQPQGGDADQVDTKATTETSVELSMERLRDAMRTRDLPGAMNSAEQLLTLSKSTPIDAKARRRIVELLELHSHLVEFWLSVDAGGKSIGLMTEIDLNGKLAAVVEYKAGRIVLRVEGENRAFTLHDMPAVVVTKLASRNITPKNPTNKVFYGAFHALDKFGDKNLARQHWNKAQAAGVNVGHLTKWIEP